MGSHFTQRDARSYVNINPLAMEQYIKLYAILDAEVLEKPRRLIRLNSAPDPLKKIYSPLFWHQKFTAKKSGKHDSGCTGSLTTKPSRGARLLHGGHGSSARPSWSVSAFSASTCSPLSLAADLYLPGCPSLSHSRLSWLKTRRLRVCDRSHPEQSASHDSSVRTDSSRYLLGGEGGGLKGRWTAGWKTEFPPIYGCITQETARAVITQELTSLGQLSGHCGHCQYKVNVPTGRLNSGGGLRNRAKL